MAEAAAALDLLRPMHAPAGLENAGTLALMLALGLGLAALLWPMLSRRRALRREALREFFRAQALAGNEKRTAQARLLRQIVRRLDGNAPFAEGAQWLARLDRVFATRFFTQGAGRCFGVALYERAGGPPDGEVDAMLAKLLAGLRR